MAFNSSVELTLCPGEHDLQDKLNADGSEFFASAVDVVEESFIMYWLSSRDSPPSLHVRSGLFSTLAVVDLFMAVPPPVLLLK